MASEKREWEAALEELHNPLPLAPHRRFALLGALRKTITDLETRTLDKENPSTTIPRSTSKAAIAWLTSGRRELRVKVAGEDAAWLADRMATCTLRGARLRLRLRRPETLRDPESTVTPETFFLGGNVYGGPFACTVEWFERDDRVDVDAAIGDFVFGVLAERCDDDTGTFLVRVAIEVKSDVRPADERPTHERLPEEEGDEARDEEAREAGRWSPTPNPIDDVACPACGRPAGKPCVTPRGGHLFDSRVPASPAVHGERQAAFRARDAEPEAPDPTRCPQCLGTGEDFRENAQGQRVRVNCPACDGRGNIPRSETEETGPSSLTKAWAEEAAKDAGAHEDVPLQASRPTGRRMRGDAPPPDFAEARAELVALKAQVEALRASKLRMDAAAITDAIARGVVKVQLATRGKEVAVQFVDADDAHPATPRRHEAFPSPAVVMPEGVLPTGRLAGIFESPLGDRDRKPDSAKAKEAIPKLCAYVLAMLSGDPEVGDGRVDVECVADLLAPLSASPTEAEEAAADFCGRLQALRERRSRVERGEVEGILAKMVAERGERVR